MAQVSLENLYQNRKENNHAWFILRAPLSSQNKIIESFDRLEFIEKVFASEDFGFCFLVDKRLELNIEVDLDSSEGNELILEILEWASLMELKFMLAAGLDKHSDVRVLWNKYKLRSK